MAPGLWCLTRWAALAPLLGQLCRGSEVLGLGDEGALVQRVASASARPPFPAQKLVAWAVTQSAQDEAGVQTALEHLKKFDWLFEPQTLAIFQDISRGISNLAHHTNRSGANRSEIMLAKRARRHTPVKHTPPVKQTVEERQREHLTREHLRATISLLLEQQLKLPSILHGTVAGMVIPDLMTLRRKSGHRERMLMDSLANISLNNISLASLPDKATQVVQAFRSAGYEALPNALEYALNVSAPALQLLRDAQVVFNNSDASLTATARLLRKLAAFPGVSNTSFYELLQEEVRLLETSPNRSASAVQLSQDLNLSAPARRLGSALFVFRDLADPVDVPEAQSRLLHHVADLFEEVFSWLEPDFNGGAAIGGFVHSLADVEKIGARGVAIKAAQLMREVGTEQDILEEVQTMALEQLHFLCKLHGVVEAVPLCEDLLANSTEAAGGPNEGTDQLDEDGMAG